MTVAEKDEGDKTAVPKTKRKGSNQKKGVGATLPEIQRLLNLNLTAAIGLNSRTEKRVKGLDKRLRQQEKRFRAVLKAIVDYNGDDPVGHARQLCEAGIDGGTKPGTIQWSFTSRILDDPTITGFCDWCFINCYGAETPKPGAMPCNVPGCPFEAPEDQKKHLTKAELKRLAAA